LLHHGRGASDDDFVHPPTETEFVGNEAGFDGLTQAYVVRDEQVDPGEFEGLAEWLELVSLDSDTGAEGGLEELFVGGSDAVPTKGIEIGSEVFWPVEVPFAEFVPCLAIEDYGIEFHLPNNLDLLPLSIVVDAREFHQRSVDGRVDSADQPMPRSDAN
jgi:hypothetical protein